MYPESSMFVIYTPTLNPQLTANKHHTKTQLKTPSLFKHNPFLCESNAYIRLKERGLCTQGIVPDFLGIIENIDPNNCNKEWAPRLNRFREDELLPNAVLIE